MTTVNKKIKELKKIRYSAEVDHFAGLSDDITKAKNFEKLCLDLAEEAIERELQAEAIEERIKELQVRKSRLKSGTSTLRELILQCMETNGKQNITSPTITLSVSRRAGSLVITDESQIPSRFFKQPPPELDKKALKEAVEKDGEIIDGTELSNGSVSLAIRRK